MMVIFWRIILVLSMTLVGLALGAWIGAQFFVSKSDGLAGGVMVLWYGVLGAIALLVISIILGGKFQGNLLSTAAIIFALLAVAIYGIVVFKEQAKFLDEAGSDKVYDAAGKYTASMERLDTSDPYLFVKMEIDSRTRKWIQTGPAPKNEIFTATLRAKQLVEIREALNDVAHMPAEVLNNCNSNQGMATKRLRWHLIEVENYQDGLDLIQKGMVNINDACLREYFAISRALQLLEKASQSPMGDIKRLWNIQKPH
jgi:hypothetical protein